MPIGSPGMEGGRSEICDVMLFGNGEPTRATEAGATTHQLMAIMGGTNIADAQRYTAAAERKRLARAGMVHILRDRSRT